MAASWTISVGGRVYGPYSLEQMQAFHAENRLAGHSLIARAGEQQFHPAREDSDLAPLFDNAMEPPRQPISHIPRFGARPDQDKNNSQPGHFVIVADMKSRSIAGLEEEIFSLGNAHRFMHMAWVLSCDASINTVRNALVQKLGKLDSLFIVDAAHDKAAWFNFGPETDTRIRKMWSRQAEPAGTEKQIARSA